MTQAPPERRLAAFVCCLRVADVPVDARQVVRHVAMAALGAGIAASTEDGIGPLRQLLLERGGAPQARTLVFGDRLPAVAAAQFNGTLCRALDFCDAMAPGPHFGSAVLPAALAAAERAAALGLPTRGEDFLAALVAGCETGARFNLSEAQYNGLDPTGVAAPFAAAAAAARMLQLDEARTLHALALAFNRCGGSFQSNIDGTLAVRTIQGWVAAAGVECAELARAGLTGPPNFIDGIYGYPHLYGRGTLPPASIVEGLGAEWRLHRTVFKGFPSCGVTQGLTHLVLQLVQELDLQPSQLQRLTIALPPYAHRLVGHPWKLGHNPRVDAQFSARYCAANAIVRRSSRLAHFAPEAIRDEAVLALIPRIEAVAEPALDARGHTAVDLRLETVDGRRIERGLDIAPGFPGAGLSPARQRARFDDCMAYAPRPLAAGAPQRLIDALDGLESLPDARALLDLMIAPGGHATAPDQDPAR